MSDIENQAVLHTQVKRRPPRCPNLARLSNGLWGCNKLGIPLSNFAQGEPSKAIGCPFCQDASNSCRLPTRVVNEYVNQSSSTSNQQAAE